MALRVLTFTTLYPNAEMPNHGIFVENRLRETVSAHPLCATVIAPVPYFPSKSPFFGRFARFARVPQREERHSIQVFHPRYALLPKVGQSSAPWLLYRAARAACRRLGFNKSTIDVIDAHYFYPDGVAAAWLAQDLGLPLVVTARGSDVNFIARDPLSRTRIVQAAEQATTVIAVADALKRRMVELGIAASKILVVRNGVDLKRFGPIDREAARRRNGLTGYTAITVGNLVPLKGHVLIIEAMASLPDCTLLIAGNGPLRPDLEAKISALGLEGRVRLLGEVPHDRLTELYGAADCSILMSEREGWPNVLLESMACGTPVLATTVGGTPEIVTRPEAGILLRERSAAALVEALRELRARPPDRVATRRYAEGFGWDVVAAANFAVLQAAAARTP
jgi:glycosyltransferase involved in cell wall biosynthesis